jgi:hypothetical protein
MRTFWLSVSALASCLVFASSLASLSACVLPTTTPDAGTTIPPGDSGPLTSAATGTGCGTDPTTKVTLCTGVSDCPGVTVSQSTFPECGFYETGGTIYLACLCSSYLCPLGQPASCGEAASMLANSDEGTICGEADNGGCTAVTTSPTPTGTMDAGGSTGADPTDGGSGCDDACAEMCDGVGPSCLEMCGC